MPYDSREASGGANFEIANKYCRHLAWFAFSIHNAVERLNKKRKPKYQESYTNLGECLAENGKWKRKVNRKIEEYECLHSLPAVRSTIC